FLLGGLIAIEGLPTLRNIHLQRTGRIVGLVFIGVAVFSYRPSTVFPGLNALLPCTGAAIYLWSGISGPSVSRWRFSPVHVANFFGRISYSLYLWHWPLIIYASFLKLTAPLNAGEIAMVAAVAVALSYMSYRFIEQPFRRKAIIPGRGSILRWAGGATALMMLASTAGIVLTSRTNDKTTLLWQSYRAFDYKKIYDAGRCFIVEYRPYEGADCLRMSATKTNVLIWGDSAAAQYLYGLRTSLDPSKFNIMLASAGACFASLNVTGQVSPACSGVSRSVGNFIANQRPDIAIVAGNWSTFIRQKGFDLFLADLRQTIADLNSRGIPVLLVGSPIQFTRPLPSLMMRAKAREIELDLAKLQQPAAFDLDNLMRANFPSRKGLTYFSILDAVCPNRQCPIWLDNDRLISFDNFHLTGEGSLYVAPYIAAAIKADLAQPQ
ncbi:MAG TPA: acyltransferase family protein, partial [Afipia sp.]